MAIKDVESTHATATVLQYKLFNICITCRRRKAEYVPPDTRRRDEMMRESFMIVLYSLLLRILVFYNKVSW